MGRGGNLAISVHAAQPLWQRGAGRPAEEVPPHSKVRELNGPIADQMQTDGEAYLSNDENNLAVKWLSHELEEGEETGWEEEAEDMADDMLQTLTDNVFVSDAASQITQAAEAFLYAKNGPIREILLCTQGNSYAFMPLNYILAKLVPPKDAELKICVGKDYSVVVDERRNIVFDNNWYFLGVSASKALEKSRNEPAHPSRFDLAWGPGSLTSTLSKKKKKQMNKKT